MQTAITLIHWLTSHGSDGDDLAPINEYGGCDQTLQVICHHRRQSTRGIGR